MAPTTGLTNSQNQTVWAIAMWFEMDAIYTSAVVQILVDTIPPFSGGNQESIVDALEQDGRITYCDVMFDLQVTVQQEII